MGISRSLNLFVSCIQLFWFGSVLDGPLSTGIKGVSVYAGSGDLVGSWISCSITGGSILFILVVRVEIVSWNSDPRELISAVTKFLR